MRLPNPYQAEIEAFVDGIKTVTKVEVQASQSYEDTPFLFVDTPETLAELREHLKLPEVSEIAIDLEAHNQRSYKSLTDFYRQMELEGRERPT